MFLKIFSPHDSDVLGELVSKMAYASLLKEDITKKAFKYLQQLKLHPRLSVHSLKLYISEKSSV